MRPQQDMEEFVRIRKPRATTSREMDGRILNDSFAAMDRITQAKQTKYEPSARRIIIRNRITRLVAAAAVIVVLISLFIVHRGPDEQVDVVAVADSTKSPAELLTVASLNIAFRRGGIEAVERQFEQVIDQLGPRPATITLRELLGGFNGT